MARLQRPCMRTSEWSTREGGRRFSGVWGHASAGQLNCEAPGSGTDMGRSAARELMTQPRARLRAKTGICWQGDEGIHAACLEDRQRGPETCRDILAEYIRRF